uniref:EF-hand domain-containing protein n=1 Tax=Octactis speculum TaxID=3111310 RepID=A0A7S2D3Y2_9STRA
MNRPYYHNTLNGESTWKMPNSIKFWMSEELNIQLLEKFSQADIAELEDKFSHMDLDCSGTIDEDELRMILEGMGERVSEARLKALIGEVDTDGSGEIDFDEFCIMMLTLMASDQSKSSSHYTGSWGRIQSGISNNQAREGEADLLKARYERNMRAKERRLKRRRYPHGRYCLCGCRQFDPALPKPRSCWFYMCLCGCFCLPCLPCTYFRGRKHIFPRISKADAVRKRTRAAEKKAEVRLL